MENIYSAVVKRLTEIGEWFIVHQLSLQCCFFLKYYSSKYNIWSSAIKFNEAKLKIPDYAFFS